MTQFENLQSRLPPHITRGQVEKVLRAIISGGEPWDWFAQARVPFPYAVAILRALRDGNFIQFNATKPPCAMTDSGDRLVQELNLRPATNLECPNCAGSGTDWSSLADVYQRYLEVFGSRPRSEDPELDQGAMTPESLFRRIALMIQQGDVAGKRIVTLGDDDLASIALSLTGLPSAVTVLEIDPRLCEFISTTARELNLSLQVTRQDLTERLPSRELGAYDTFLCDPPETEAGLLLFVEKGLALLKPNDGHAGYFGATVLEASLEKWKRWQKRLLDHHEVAFTHILAPFTEYLSWPDEKPLPDLPPLAHLALEPWYRFAFYRLETLPSFLNGRDFELEHTQLFYFDDESYYEGFR